MVSFLEYLVVFLSGFLHKATVHFFNIAWICKRFLHLCLSLGPLEGTCEVEALCAIENFIADIWSWMIGDKWKISEVISLPKHGDHEIPNNNRPVSLLPAASKIC